MVEHGHVPRSVDQRAVDCFRHVSPRIQDQQTSSLGRCRGAICGGQTADDHPATAQRNQRCCETDTARASAGKTGSVNLGELADRAARGYLHNRSSGSLVMGHGVEVAKEQVPLHEVSNRARNDEDAIRVYIAVAGTVEATTVMV